LAYTITIPVFSPFTSKTGTNDKNLIETAKAISEFADSIFELNNAISKFYNGTGELYKSIGEFNNKAI